MFSEVTAWEVPSLVKKTHNPVSATSFPSVTNTFLVQPDCWPIGAASADADAEADADAVGA